MTLAVSILLVIGSVSIAQDLHKMVTPFRFADDSFILVAVPTGEYQNYIPSPSLSLRHPEIGNGDRSMTIPFEQLRLTSRRGKDIFAYRLKSEAPHILFTNESKTVDFTNFVDASRELCIAPGDIVPGYNCHGLTFAHCQFVIDNDHVSTLLESDYDECTPTDAEVVIYFNHDNVVHSVSRVLREDELVFVAKGGIRGVEIVRSVEAASCDLAYDALGCFKMKREEPKAES
jgi:hypothetical protein